MLKWKGAGRVGAIVEFMISRVAMCTLVILRRPGHGWPVLIGANRDELVHRAWKPPGRHWPDRADVTAGLDVEAGGSWLGANDDGVVAGVLNRTGTLGPQAGMRSRGELVLDALDHADARDAAAALARIDGRAYRTFNLVIADARDAFLLCHRGAADGRVDVAPIGPGLSMIASLELNDLASPRIAGSLDRFRAATPPDPEASDWSGWSNLLADRSRHLPDDPGSALNIVTDHGYGTVSSSLIALPEAAERRIIWLFSAGAPDRAPWYPVGAPAHTPESGLSAVSE